jgi:RHS repeat-associated protein
MNPDIIIEQSIDEPQSYYAVYLSGNEGYEWPVYGSDRHGRFGRLLPTPMILSADYLCDKSNTGYDRYLGYKDYELKDHLGNVRLVFSDMRLMNVTVPYNYFLNVRDISDYYPFGSLQSGELENIGGNNFVAFNDYYRYGYTGMERDDDIKGTGNSYTTRFRQYDSRLGRWLSVDPLAMKFPWSSPYVGMGNNPVVLSDKLGSNPEVEGSVKVQLTYSVGASDITSGFNLALAGGFSVRDGLVQSGLNLSLNISNSGLGMFQGQQGPPRMDFVMTPSFTMGLGENLTAAPLLTFQNSAISSVTNSFANSFTFAQNFVFSNKNGYQKSGSLGIKSGDVSLQIYNDTGKLFGDGGDRWWTGGGSLTFSNFLGNGNNRLTIGNDVFTGNSNTREDINSVLDPQYMTTYEVGNNTAHYAYQDKYNQLLNMGNTFIRLNTNSGVFQANFVGNWSMISQNTIHDKMFYHRFFSNITDELQYQSGLK